MSFETCGATINNVLSEQTVEKLASIDKALTFDGPLTDWDELYLGFDLGTTNMKLVALNESGQPVSAVLNDSRS